MEVQVQGAALGAAFELLVTSVAGASMKVVGFRSQLERVKSTLCAIKPSIDDIESLNLILGRPPHETEAFTVRLMKAERLVRRCSKIAGTALHLCETKRIAVADEQKNLTMARLLGLTRAFGEWAESPREVTRTIPTSESIGESGWLIRFFDSSFFCIWIAVSYLYKHDHPGVRDYLCNRMYTLPLSGIESYLFQICYMLIHKPSPSLDKFVIDICSRSLKIALKVQWFLMAELEDVDDNEGISRIQEKCQFAATLMGEWPPLIKPQTGSSGFMSFSSNINISSSSPIGKNQVLNRLLSSKQKLLSFTSSPPSSTQASRSLSFSPSPGISQDDGGKVLGSPDESNKIFKKFIPGAKVRDALLFRKSTEKEDEEPDKDGGFFKKLLRDSRDEDVRRSGDRNKEFVEETEKEGGFFKRLLRDSRDEDARKSLAKENEKEPEKEGGVFKRLLKDGRDEEMKKSVDRSKDEEEHEKEGGFFKRLLSSSRDEDVKQSVDTDDDVSEKDGFLRRIVSTYRYIATPLPL
ncbi:1-phosphatidylinositol 4-kinase [Salvia divinorum]|uniref:1-phosphatidylinositol 4-kinase n=1 Tax=Salvia divinorum TaxID=28513 RepID=A0ABD1G4Z2_SALDI